MDVQEQWPFQNVSPPISQNEEVQNDVIRNNSYNFRNNVIPRRFYTQDLHTE